MFGSIHSPHSLEILEARIAPAVVFPTIQGAEKDPSGSHFVSAVVGSPILIKAGDVLTTGKGARSGSYLMFVEKGQALVFTTDFNNNKLVDFNEITGIAAGEGLRLISFVDIGGDIVTNLQSDTTLSDSNNNSPDDNPSLRGDGRVVLDNRIEKIELRALKTTDLTDQNADGFIDLTDVGLRLALTSFSIHGSVYAGRGLGVSGDLTSGIIIDDTGRATMAAEFNTPAGFDFYSESLTPLKPTIGSVKVGTSVSGEYFSFGVSRENDVQGILRSFTPSPGEVGASIVGVVATTAATTFNLIALEAGNGGLGARGGNIENIRLNSDNAGGYSVLAGNGGRGSTGGAGGAIVNFQDLGSVTSQMVIKSGNGGNGTTGAGGAGGTVTFGTLNVQGGLAIDLGNGGDGFTAGGAGASLLKATISTAGIQDEYGRAIVGTTHDGPHNPFTGLLLPDADTVATGVQAHMIGTHNPVDFNNDGFGDIVFTTSNPEQVVVQFGDGDGGFLFNPVTRAPVRIYLDAPTNPEAITIGDFNGDNHMDIAVASSSTGSFSGITVFLSRYEDGNNDGLSLAEDLNGNGADDLLGFHSGRHTALPDLHSGDPTVPVFTFYYRYARSAHAINDLAAGDFNGDGITDLAVVATYYTKTGLAPFVVPRQVLLFLTPDVEDGRPTGQFFADVGTKQIAVPPQGANPYIPFIQLTGANGGDATALIEATALADSATHDVIVAAVPGRRSLQEVDGSVQSINGPTTVFFALGMVDTNRLLAGVTNNITLQGASVKDFTILDFNNDHNADFAAITLAPSGFLVAMVGDGFGSTTVTTFDPNGTNNTTAPLVINTNQNLGFYFGPPGQALSGLNVGTTQVAIRSGDLYGHRDVNGSFTGTGDGVFDDIAVLDYGISPGSQILDLTLIVPNVAGAPPPARFVPVNPGAVRDFIPPQSIPPLLSRFLSVFDDTAVVAFDLFYPNIADIAAVNYAAATPTQVIFPGQVGVIRSLGDRTTFTTTQIPLVENFFSIKTGDGGDALLGRAGSGGGVGTTINPTTLLGSINITNDRGEAFLTGGAGGNGFKGGGAGGTIRGVVARGEGAVLTAGDGGFAVSGTGGAGGSILDTSIGGSVLGGGIVFTSIFNAGDGGRGLIGGDGGSIRGNAAGLFDTQHIDQFLTGGRGGAGVKAGGHGGSIVNFHAALNLFVLGSSGGLLSYVAGDGGSAVSGPGGNGGSVTNTSPLTSARNQLAGDILLQGGNGGDGLRGGQGGSVDTFLNNPGQTDIPAVLSFLGGNGGRGVTGVGGNGGNVSNVSSPSTGSPNQLDVPATAYSFNRILGGNGGESTGNNGGNGGTVSGVKASNQDQVFAIAAGAGGAGLYRGGNGGSVLASQVQIGHSQGFAKAVIIAGDGGAATAFLANLNDNSVPNQGSKAFGGLIGRGGDGGSIVGFTQKGAVDIGVDLIAGNGGDNVNYGSLTDRASNVGRGGSVQNIRIDGNLGNSSPTTPIKSYNNVMDGQTMAQFVNATLRDPLSPGALTDDVGNVGVVVGAAGRLKSTFEGYTTAGKAKYASIPANGGINGSLIDVQARSLMAAVAGSVEQIAAIQIVKGVVLTGNGQVGVDKKLEPTNYRDRNLLPVPAPVLDGKLIDGAMVTRTTPTNLAGVPVNLGPYVFVIA